MKKQKGNLTLDGMVTAGAAAGAVAVSQVHLFNSWLIPGFNVPVTVITMAAGGALVSFAHGEPMRDRKRLFKIAAANTFIATVAVVVVPRMFGLEWAIDEAVGPLAAAMAWVSRWAIPATINLVPDMLKKMFGLGDYNTKNIDSYYYEDDNVRQLEDKYFDEQQER